MKEREKAWYWLANIMEIGVHTTQKLLEYASDIEELVLLSATQLEKAHICTPKMLAAWDHASANKAQIQKQYEELPKKGISFLTRESANYPKRLLNLPDAPYGLWLKGKLPEEKQSTAAVIGSRDCTAYGVELAVALGRYLAEIGVQVISGMARGIDGCAQRGALEKNGYSLGVLACGVDVCYPRENWNLYYELTRRGGVLSESPLGVKGMPYLFPIRNRLISGLSDCLVVVEAREKSGTQITVSCALEQGKDIFAVPGRMTDPLSKGCNQMVGQGAAILTDFSDLALYFQVEERRMAQEKKLPKLTAAEQAVYESLTDEPQHFEEFLMKTQLSVGELMQSLIALESMGMAKQPTKNYYLKVPFYSGR